MPDDRFRTIAAASTLAMGLAVMCHEGAHALTGWLAGGSPTLWTSTELRGNFDALTTAGYVALGISGSLTNVVLGALGWWGLRRRTASMEFRLTAWFFLTANVFLVTTKMMGEAAAGFGDWWTILGHLPATTELRIVVFILGGAGLMWGVRRSGTALATLLPGGDRATRARAARRIVGIGAAAAAVLLVGGSIANPVGPLRGGLLSLGALVGPFLPMVGSIRVSLRHPETAAPLATARTWPMMTAAGALAAVFWFVVGPGIAL